MFKTGFFGPHKTQNFFPILRTQNQKPGSIQKLKTRLILETQKSKQDTKTKTRWISQNTRTVYNNHAMLKTKRQAWQKLHTFAKFVHKFNL